MLRLHDPRTGRPGDLPGGRALRVLVPDEAGLRTCIVADLLRRAAGRAGRHVQVMGPSCEFAEYGVQPFDPVDGLPVDVQVGGTAGDVLTLAVGAEPVSWADGLDPLAARLMVLETHYRSPLAAGETSGRLSVWREAVAEWANAPGRPLVREYAATAEAALADDLDSARALTVLDEIAADASMPPGAKLETFIHLDLLFGLNLVASIGRG